jgi:hypothetical protein
VSPKNAIISGLLLSLIAAGCTAQPPRRRTYSDSFSADSSNASEELERAREMGAVSVRFFHGDFFSLIDPNQNSCAGDVRYYSDPWEIDPTNGGTRRLPASYTDSAISTKPAFVRNVAVDITDANSNSPANEAYGCSFGQGPASPPKSNCATFDYGALSGVSSSLQGSLLLFGGVTSATIQGTYPPIGGAGSTHLTCGPNNTGDSEPNACSKEVYALAVETLPSNTATDPPNALAPGLTSATEPISTWAKISTAESQEFPPPTAGAATALSVDGQRLLVYGGSSNFALATGPARDSHQTWVLNLESSTWDKGPTFSSNSQSIATMKDCHFNGCYSTAPGVGESDRDLSPSIQSAKAPGGRAGFGYAAVPNSGLTGILDASRILTLDPAHIDLTDRIFIAGGSRGSDPVGGMVYSQDLHRFNPTFGPEYKDRGDAQSSDETHSLITHWIDSSPFQLLTTGKPHADRDTNPYTVINDSVFSYPGSTAYFDSGSAWIGFAFAPLVYPLDAGGVIKIGTVVAAGGISGSRFLRDSCGQYYQGLHHTFATLPNPTPTPCVTPTPSPYPLDIHRKISAWNRSNRLGGHLATQPRAFAGLPTYDLDRDPFEVHPLNGELQYAFLQQQLEPKTDLTVEVLPHWIHGTLVPGLYDDTELVYFGGLNCEYAYLHSPSGKCFSSPAVTVEYNAATSVYRFANKSYLNGKGELDDILVNNNPIGRDTNVPKRGAMAVAKGKDGATRDIIVAWGGLSAHPSDLLYKTGYTASHTGSKLYILDRNGGTVGANYRWSELPVSGMSPPEAAGAQLVYSTVTGKYYLFGGYHSQPQPRFLNETWELTLSSCLADPLATGSCVATWKKLDSASGMTCSPDCTDPPPRRSHRMVEVNYNRGAACTADEPCSYGIFMEGGTWNGSDVYADRWMFDPTANGGRGHWQRVNDFPARTLAQASAVQLKAAGATLTRNFAVMYGGQTGMGGPSPTGQSFVPPTLGDTHLYDYELKNWSRVRLAGLGVAVKAYLNYEWLKFSDNSTPYRSHNPTSSEFRQYFSVRPSVPEQEQLKVLTPPPLSGAIQVVRTLSAPANDGPLSKKLAIPEVYLFGGRKKDGSFMRFNEVYKFCAGSSGETLIEKPGSGNSNGECDQNEYAAGQCYESTACDAYDPEVNPYSPHPITDEAFGRWLQRRPGLYAITGSSYANPSVMGSFMGAGTYDSRRDRIVITGGWNNPTHPSVTRQTGAEILSDSDDHLYVYEYTPPTRPLHRATATISPAVADEDAKLQGRWNAYFSCNLIGPAPRYGHSMAYDAVHEQILVIGGFYGTDTPNWNVGDAIQHEMASGVRVPEVWKGKFNATGSCYDWIKLTTFGNSTATPNGQLPEHGLGFASAAFLPGTAYNSGYYTTQDQACVGSGPIQSEDPEVSKLLAGGVYLDLNRDELGPNENVLLHLTYIALSPQQISGSGAALASNDITHFKVHLVASGTSANEMQAAQQPRHLYYSDTERYLKIVDSIAVLSPADGAVRSEQFVLPVASDSRIDRIRVERHSGSAILIEAKLIRMGYR